MPLVSTFSDLLLSFSVVMTEPTFHNFLVIARGWIQARGKRTVTGVIEAAGAVGQKHHSVFHRFFSRARWCVEEVGHVVLSMALRFVPKDRPVYLVVDDTLCRKRGLHIFGTCMHHDPLISCRKVRLVNWGHNWVVVGLVLRFPFAPHIAWCLPFAFRLYISRKRPKSQRWKYQGRRVHRTRPELAVEILRMVANWHPERHFRLLGDSAYGGGSVLKHLPGNFHLTSRIVLNAALYESPKKRLGRGRPRKKGRRLASPAQVAADSRRRWKIRTLAIYGKKRKVKVKEMTGLWKAGGYRRIKIVIVRDTSGKTPDQAFYTTDVQESASDILAGYAQRWSVEVAFENSKSHFGFQDPQNRKRKAVERTAPVAMALYSAVIIWFAKHGYKRCRFPYRPWYRKKATPSFVDMMNTLRRESAREYFLNTPEWNRHTRKIMRAFCEGLGLAA